MNQEKINELESKIKKMVEPNEYSIEPSKHNLEELKKILKMGDKYTMEYLIEYLKSDNYELIKNLGAIINKDNVSEVYQYREGALSRNEALIKILKEVIATSTFVNRKTNTVQQVVKS